MQREYEFYIRTTPDLLWQAICDPAVRARYHFGTAAISTWAPGARIEVTAPGVDGLLGEGEVLEADRPHRLVHTLVALWSEEVAAEGASRVTWAIEPIEDTCRLLLTHDQMRDGANEQLYGGWPMILCGMKTWLETGTRLTTPGSLLYS
jgi:uncharacterized protein YndB with AHSA1/START domain